MMMLKNTNQKTSMINNIEIRHAHICGGLGGGGKGFNKASPRVGNMVGKMRCLGSVDVDPAGCRDFERLTGTPATLMDLFDRSQYADFHGTEPPEGWTEATPADLRRAFGDEHPHIIFTSTPCKGLSGLMSENKSKTAKYQAWRERIGNAVPPDAARAIAEVMGTTLLLSWSGETFILSSTPVWVRPVAMALSVSQGVII